MILPARRGKLSLLIPILTLLGASPAWAPPPDHAPHPASAPPAALQPFTAEDLMRLKRITDPQVSPDGRYVAYVLRETDIEADTGRTDIWLLDLTHPQSTPHRLTTHPANDSSPRWAPDSRTIYFLSSRSGTSQVWRLSLDGGEATRVTEYPLSIGALKVAPNGNTIALTMAVFPGCADLRCTQEQLAARARTKATGRLYNQLFIRHWDTWSDGTRSHLFAARINADGRADAPVDLSKNLDADVPSKPFGGDEDFAFSPDSSRLVFSARIAGRTEPWSTNFDLFEVPVDRTVQPKNLTRDNPAWDARPVFLRNGDLAWLAMDRPTFESDRFHIMLRSARTGAVRAVTQNWDRSIVELSASFDGRSLLATVQDLGQQALYAIDPGSGARHPLVNSGEVQHFAASRTGAVITWANLAAPADLYSVGLSGATPQRLTEVNAELLGRRRLSEFEQFSFAGWHDEKVYGYVMKPYGFTAGGHYPIAFLVHGGPQAAFANLWHYRWNAQTFAGAGYGVVMIDFHGTPGYGQAFTDSISQDWGGKPLEDLQKGLAAAVSRYGWLDGQRACALGASYGGFMMNWIEGHWPNAFRCIVNHDGVFDARMMYYTTEELWFEEWENGGPQYANPQAYERFNPINSVAQWHTPMLIVHGQQDFRIPYTQGIGAFTALQRRGIESRLLLFPDENHWVLKPANVVLWYQNVLGWLDEHSKQ